MDKEKTKDKDIEKIIEETAKKIDILCGHESGLTGQAALELITKKLKLILYRTTLEKSLEIFEIKNEEKKLKYLDYLKHNHETLKNEINDIAMMTVKLVQEHESASSVQIRFAKVIRKMLILQKQDDLDATNSIA